MALLTPACASSFAPRIPAQSASRVQPDPERVAAFATVEESAIEWLAVADPRLARRANVVAPEALLERVGTDAVLAEDTTAQIRGVSLDLFAFKARKRALRQAADQVAAFAGPLPDAGPADGPLIRPELERELLG